MKTIVPEITSAYFFSSMAGSRMDTRLQGMLCRTASWVRHPGNQIRATVKWAAPHVVRQRVLTVVKPHRANIASAAKMRKPS